MKGSKKRVLGYHPTPRCPTCLSRNSYYRVRSKSFMCRKCGAIFRWTSKTGYTTLGGKPWSWIVIGDQP